MIRESEARASFALLKQNTNFPIQPKGGDSNIDGPLDPLIDQEEFKDDSFSDHHVMSEDSIGVIPDENIVNLRENLILEDINNQDNFI